MNVIDRHIRYLLKSKGAVCVPGLGVFTASRCSASFVGDELLAPGRMVSFTPDDKCYDDVLVASVSRQLKISESDASTVVHGEVNQWLHLLSLGIAVEIEGVGTLKVHQTDACVVFETCAEAEREWLRPLALAPIVVEASEPTELSAEVEENRRRLVRSIARTASSAAAIAIMVLIAFIASQLPSTETQDMTYASLPIGPISNLSITSDGSPVERTAHSDHALVLILNTPADGVTDVAPVKEPVGEVATEARYCLVVASLYSRSEAERFIALQSADPALEILEKDGRFRVYAAQGATIADVKAEAEARHLYDSFPSGWICRK